MSLATADLIVGLIVIPLSATAFIFGPGKHVQMYKYLSGTTPLNILVTYSIYNIHYLDKNRALIINYQHF
jgi:hypothetical protein